MNNKTMGKEQNLNKGAAAIKKAFREAFYELQKDSEVNFITWAKKNPDEFKRLRCKPSG